MIFHANIAKYGFDPLPPQRVCRGNKGEGGHDYFPFQIQCSLEEFQAYGRIAHADAVLDSKHRSYAFF
jgi:hypothetical protein